MRQATAVVSTGPSLDKSVIKFIKKNYNDIICVSDTYKVFGMLSKALVSSDSKWWDYHKPFFLGYKFCLSNPGSYDLKRHDLFKDLSSGGVNSALFALLVAKDFFNATDIDLYGVDMTNKNGDHFFGSHPDGFKNSDDASFERFKKQFLKHERNFILEGVSVINRNPESELNVFEKRSMYDD